MMKSITTLTIGILLLLTSESIAQCTLSTTPATITIDCGQSVDLDALGLSPAPVLSTNFNGGALGPGWSTTGVMLYTNPCGPTLSGTPAAWFGNVPLPRTLTTNSFDLSCGGQVCFELDFAADDVCGGCTDCEDPDQIDEGVFFQYSIDAGVTWVDIFYFDPQPNYAAGTNPIYGWQNYCFTIPAVAWTTATMFRWDQPNATSSVNDHWGIDNVSILPSDCSYWYDWSNLPPAVDPSQQTVSPQTSTTYYVDYTDGFDICSDSVVVTVNPLVAEASVLDTNINCGLCTDLDVILLNDNSGSIVDDFDPAEDPAMWSNLSGATANLNCGSVTGNALHFDGTGTRNATTIPIDATVCTNISFSLFIGNIGSGGAPCENADANENVVLQYSTNGGTTWTDIITYDQTNWDTNNSWQAFTEAIPLAAQTLNTLFRWTQPQFSACNGCDNWAIDNVNIACSPPVYTYSWTPAPLVSDPAIQNPTTCPAADNTYTATITNALTGCSATDDVSVFVGACVCQFNSFTYTINQCEAGGTYSITGDFEYFLNPGTGTLIIEATNASGTYTQTIPGPFADYTLTNYNVTGIPSDGSPVTITVYFSDETTCQSVLNDNSPVLPTVTNFAGGATYCAGDAIAPLLVDVTGTGPWTIDYTLDGVALSATGAASPIDLGNTNAGVYVLTLVTDANCSNAASETQTIIVNDLPTVTNVFGEGAYCIGDPINDIFADVTGVGPWTVDYTIDGAANSVSDPASPLNLGNTPGVYIVTGVSDANCSNSAIGTQTIIMNPLPAVSAGADFTICEGDATVLNGSGAATYVWDNGVTNDVLFNPTATATYTVIGTDANGCVFSDNVVLTIEPLPIVSFIADDTDGCSPLAIQFTNTTPGNIAECVWNIEGASGDILGCDISYTFDVAGLFDVQLTTTTASGCVNSATYTDYIYIESDPIADFVPSTSTISVYNSDVSFINTSYGATNYLWDFGEGMGTSTEAEPWFTYPPEVSSNYSVTLYALSSLGCIDSLTRQIIYEEEVIFYVPNAFTPDDDEFNQNFQAIFTSGYDPYDFNMTIYNRWGEIVFETNDDTVGWDGTYNGKMVQTGTYTWNIEFKTIYSDERVMVNGHLNLLK
ncbi:MAG: gliding motility-associated C-terminal domain-containing protein [Crocinitomicaceae bacterium]|nr:gliding motility-associated C-terminal domain-containing protein [Crocinitomicaceae bacterium]